MRITHKPQTLWYEDANGNPVPHDFKTCTHPKGARYQISQFPTTLYTKCYVLNEDGTSQEGYTGSASYPEDLVLAMANSGDYTLGESILIAANACERCLNVLGHTYGLK